jgi:hypothetical protein
MADNRQDYGKSSTVSSGSSMHVSGGSSSGSNNGPTGSSRDYPKGKSIRSTEFNPMKCCASTYGINGV